MNLNQLRTEFVRWLAVTQELSPLTVTAYGADVLALERFLGPTFEVAQLDTRALYGFVEHLSTAPLQAVTIRRRLAGVRRFCDWLVHQGHVDQNPMEPLKLRLSRSRRLPRALSEHDLRRLLRHLCDTAGLSATATCEPIWRPVEATTLLAVALMVATGMRVGEVAGLRVQDVDVQSRTVLVLGKGLRERYVYLSNDWIVWLLRLHAFHRIVGDMDPGDEALLLNRHRRPLSTSALRCRIAKAGRAADLSAPLTPHMLRHTAATQLIEEGVDIRFVQRLLGHASLVTTEVYTHVADRSLRHAVTQADVLGKALNLR